jgi:hypothetical protein
MDAKPDHESTRASFEAFIGGEPFVRPVFRFPIDFEKFAFPGAYQDINTDLAWWAWKAAIEHATAGKRLVSETLLTQLQAAAVAIATIPQSEVEGSPEVLLDRARDLIQAAEDVLFERERA